MLFGTSLLLAGTCSVVLGDSDGERSPFMKESKMKTVF